MNWKNAAKQTDDVYFNNADAIVIARGETLESNPYQKTPAIQNWLFGYEFPETIAVLTQEKMWIITGVKRGAVMETLLDKVVDKQIPVEILKRSKDGSNQQECFDKVLSVIRSSREGKRIGVIAKETFEGPVYEAWQASLSEFEKVDVTSGLSLVLAVKDEESIRSIRDACRVSSTLLKDHVIDEILSVIDEDRKVTHQHLSTFIENYIYEDKKRKKLRLGADIEPELLDMCYPPIVQSGAKFNLRPSAVSDEHVLYPGIIICSLGIRYRSFCSNVGRTFLVDPDSEQEKNYEFLLELQRYVLGCIRDGVLIRDVYLKGVDYVKQHRPDLESKLVKNFGFGMGLEFRESDYVIHGKNSNELMANMILNLAIGFQDLENRNAKDEQEKVYSLLLVDTVKVTNSEPTVMTEVGKKLKDISFQIAEDKQEEEEEESKGQVKTAILRTKLRGQKQEESGDSRRKEHQKELAESLVKEMLERYKGVAAKDASAEQKMIQKSESYKKDTYIPREVKDLKIHVDKRAETIVLPMYGLAVPFHISFIKNVTKNEEGEFIYLRFNFNSPGQTFGKKDANQFEDENAVFVRTLTFRSADIYRMSEIFKEITELKKAVTKREAERKEMADLVVQDNLIETKGKVIRLNEVYMRPTLEGKRVPGYVEIHSNGLRYKCQLKANQNVDLLFSNIKHLFFQPCDKELIALIHLHLKNPIMIGKKKTKDVQFFREAVDTSVDETNRSKKRNHWADEDELASEQEERRRKAAVNNEFKLFAEKIMDASSLEVDVPFRELGFDGCPFRQSVLLQPTTECLVHLTDTPFLVVTLHDVELAQLERVAYGLKNFDLVFVFKDHSIPVVHVNSIPMTSLENVKEWLDSMDVVYAEAPVNYNWPNLLKVLNEDPVGFYEMGGWDFMREDEQVGESEQEAESGSEFEDEVESEVESETDEFSGSEVDEDEDSDASEEDEDDEEGMDWDELEEETRKQDDLKKRKALGGVSQAKKTRH